MPHEPSAAERAQAPAAMPRIDDDLAAALSAALVTPAPEAGVEMAAPVAPVASAASADSAPWSAVPPVAAAAAAQPAYTPSTYSVGMVAWAKGDDDIFPTTAGKKR